MQDYAIYKKPKTALDSCKKIGLTRFGIWSCINYGWVDDYRTALSIQPVALDLSIGA